MKKYLITLIIIGVTFSSLAKAETLYSFADGNSYDVSGTWQCLWLMDGNCYDLQEHIIATRPTTTSATLFTIPTSTPSTIYIPVYVPNTPEPILPSQATSTDSSQQIAGSEPFCTLTATSTPPGQGYGYTVTWVSNETDPAYGTLYSISGTNGGKPIYINPGISISSSSGSQYNLKDIEGWSLVFSDGVTCSTNP